MNILVIDDSQTRQKFFARTLNPGNSLIQVFNYEQAIEALEKYEPFDLIFLDHDLSLEQEEQNNNFLVIPSIHEIQQEKTGYDVAKYIIAMETSKIPKQIIIHSLNPPAIERMLDLLKNAGLNVSKLSYLEFYNLNK